MSLTFTQARDGIFDRFNTDWAALAPAQNDGNLPAVDWQGDDEGTAPDNSQPWARVTILHGTGSQESLGETGNRLFGRSGTVIVNVFAPLSRGQGLTQAEALATIARNAFEGKTAGPSDCIWFRDVVINEVGPDGAWFQMNVLATFLYDELK